MTTAQLPPKNRRGGSAIFHIEYSLQEIEQLFQGLLSLYPTSKTPVSEDLAANLNEPEEAGFDKFCEIYEPVIMQECKIAHKAELVCLMSSIQAESEINRFLHFNFESGDTYPAESMAASERLVAALNIINKPHTEKNSIFETVRILLCWGNSYTHSSSSVTILKANNILQPCELGSLSDSLALLIIMVGAYIRVSRFLRQVGKNKRIPSINLNEKHICSLINKVSQHYFDGDKWSNKGFLGKRELAKVSRIVSKAAISGDYIQKVLLENCLATLPSQQEQILLMELGLGNHEPLSRKQIILETGLSAKRLYQERSLALTSISSISSLLEPLWDAL